MQYDTGYQFWLFSVVKVRVLIYKALSSLAVLSTPGVQAGRGIRPARLRRAVWDLDPLAERHHPDPSAVCG
jgi:hypothetical protein